MTDSMQAAAALAHKLGSNFEAVLPETEPIIDCDAMAADRMELRQVAGISAGGCLELRPGNYDFGPVKHGRGRLGGGEPDEVGFTLRLDDRLGAVIGPAGAPLLLDGEEVSEPTDLDGRIINAGSARFVVARPRPPKRRGASSRETELGRTDRWVLNAIPSMLGGGGDLSALIELRRRLHLGPEETCHRINQGRGHVWGRGPEHPLFGTAVVAMADIMVHGRELQVSAPVPVAINLRRSTTTIVGERRLQLAVARHILLALAAATHPDDLQIGLLSDDPGLEFVHQLPHGSRRSRDSVDERARQLPAWQLMVVDGPGDHAEWIDDRWAVPGSDSDRTSLLILTGEDDPVSADSDVLTVVDESTMSIRGARGEAPIDGATPVGFAHSMAVELMAKLRHLDPIDG